MEKLTMQEEEAMRWIWRIGTCFVKDADSVQAEDSAPFRCGE